MTKQTYRLDVSKIKTLKDARNVFDLMNLVGSYDPEDPEDDYYHLREYFTILQEPQGLTFSTPRKSIEEIQQELDEKFEELLVKTKGRFNASKETAEYYYDTKFDRIIDTFEEAKKWGRFPQPIKLIDGTGLCANVTKTILEKKEEPQDDKDLKIKELEEENKKLKEALKTLQDT